MKKVFFISLAALLTVSFSGVASAEELFNDVSESHPNYEAIEYTKSSEIFEGYEDGSFGSTFTIRREELLKVIMEAAGVELTSEASACFTDIDPAAWHAPYVCTAKDMGIITGYEDGSFGVGNVVNFAEASKMVVNTLDVADVSDDAELWFKNYVEALEAKNAIPETVFSFDQAISRDQMAEILWRLLENIESDQVATYSSIEAGEVKIDFMKALPSNSEMYFGIDFAQKDQINALFTFINETITHFSGEEITIEEMFETEFADADVDFEADFRTSLEAGGKLVFAINLDLEGFVAMELVEADKMAEILRKIEANSERVSYEYLNGVEYWFNDQGQALAKLDDTFIANRSDLIKQQVGRFLINDGFSNDAVDVSSKLRGDGLFFAYVSKEIMNTGIAEEIANDFGIEVKQEEFFSGDAFMEMHFYDGRMEVSAALRANELLKTVTFENVTDLKADISNENLLGYYNITSRLSDILSDDYLVELPFEEVNTLFGGGVSLSFYDAPVEYELPWFMLIFKGESEQANQALLNLVLSEMDKFAAMGGDNYDKFISYFLQDGYYLESELDMDESTLAYENVPGTKLYRVIDTDPENEFFYFGLLENGSFVIANHGDIGAAVNAQSVNENVEVNSSLSSLPIISGTTTEEVFLDLDAIVDYFQRKEEKYSMETYQEPLSEEAVKVFEYLNRFKRGIVKFAYDSQTGIVRAEGAVIYE